MAGTLYTSSKPLPSSGGQSLQKTVAGFGSPKHSYDESRSTPAMTAALSFVPQVFGGSDGRAHALPVSARSARSSNLSELPPSFGSGDGGFSKPHSLEAIMATSVSTRTPAQSPATIASASNAAPGNEAAPWSVSFHASTSRARPVRLLALGEGPDGKTARFEFPEGWERTIVFLKPLDAWHPLFADLPIAESIRLREHTHAPVITMMADGQRKEQGALSFTTHTLTARGRITASSDFDVPEEDYSAGQITGYRCAAELLEAMQRNYGPVIPLAWILREAGLAGLEACSRPSRRGAAVGFLSVVGDALRFMANNAEVKAYMASKIQNAEKHDAWNRAQATKDKAAFVERMRKGREAKQAAREVQHG